MTLTENDYTAAIKSLDSAETGEELMQKIDSFIAQMGDAVPVEQPSI